MTTEHSKESTALRSILAHKFFAVDDDLEVAFRDQVTGVLYEEVNLRVVTMLDNVFSAEELEDMLLWSIVNDLIKVIQ